MFRKIRETISAIRGTSSENPLLPLEPWPSSNQVISSSAPTSNTNVITLVPLPQTNVEIFTPQAS
jgi:hypothetical protein